MVRSRWSTTLSRVAVGVVAGFAILGGCIARARADHPGGGPEPSGGFPALGWLFVAGFLVLLGLVAWAVFAPRRDDDETPGGRGPTAALALLALLAAASGAGAHATAQRFEPRPGATLVGPPAEIRITFDGSIEHAFSSITLTDGAGRGIPTGRADVDPISGRILRLRLPRLDPGAYTVRWRVLAVDGHRTEGRYTFTVKPGP